MAACSLIMTEGIEHRLEAHAKASQYCRERAEALGLKLFPVVEAVNSPSGS